MNPFVYSLIATAVALASAACNLAQLAGGADWIVCQCPNGSISSRDCRPGGGGECRCGGAPAGGAPGTGATTSTGGTGATTSTGGTGATTSAGGAAGSGGTAAGGTGAVGSGGGTNGFPPIEDP